MKTGKPKSGDARFEENLFAVTQAEAELEAPQEVAESNLYKQGWRVCSEGKERDSGKDLEWLRGYDDCRLEMGDGYEYAAKLRKIQSLFVETGKLSPSESEDWARITNITPEDISHALEFRISAKDWPARNDERNRRAAVRTLQKEGEVDLDSHAANLRKIQSQFVETVRMSQTDFKAWAAIAEITPEDVGLALKHNVSSREWRTRKQLKKKRTLKKLNWIQSDFVEIGQMLPEDAKAWASIAGIKEEDIDYALLFHISPEQFLAQKRRIDPQASATLGWVQSKFVETGEVSPADANAWAAIAGITEEDIGFALKLDISPKEWQEWKRPKEAQVSGARYVSTKSGESLRTEEWKKKTADARRQKCDWVCVGGTYYRYFEEGEGGDWKRASQEDVATIRNAIRRRGEPWFDGPVISRNHGTVIVPPYIRSDGVKVRGHTKSAKGQGPAKKRDVPVSSGLNEAQPMTSEG